MLYYRGKFNIELGHLLTGIPKVLKADLFKIPKMYLFNQP